MNLEFYNKMVSDKLKKYDMDYAKNFDLVNISSNNELLSGGTKARKHVMVGTDSSTYAPNFNAPEKLVGLSGGKKKKSIYDNMNEFADGFVYGFTKPLEIGADIASKVVPIAKQVAPLMAAAGKSDLDKSDLDKAKESLQKYVDGKKKTKPTKKHLDLLEEHGIISKEKEGGSSYNVSGGNLKQAKKWEGFAVDTANDGLNLVKKGKKVFGGNLKAAKKWEGFAVDTANDGLNLVKKGKKVFGGAKKTQSPWIAHVKKVAAAQGIPYNQALKIAGASYKK